MEEPSQAESKREEKHSESQGLGLRLIKEIASLLALAGIAFYAFLSYSYERFYVALGVDPVDVGLSYAAILARSAGFITASSFFFALFGLIVGSVLAALISSIKRSIPDMERQRKGARIAVTAGSLIVLGILIFASSIIPQSATEAASMVKSGWAVRPFRTAWPFFITLAVRADPVKVFPASKSNEIPALKGLDTEGLFFLGQANGTTVLYDSTSQEAIYLPSSSIIVRAINCERDKPNRLCPPTFAG